MVTFDGPFFPVLHHSVLLLPAQGAHGTFPGGLPWSCLDLCQAQTQAYLPISLLACPLWQNCQVHLPPMDAMQPALWAGGETCRAPACARASSDFWQKAACGGDARQDPHLSAGSLPPRVILSPELRPLHFTPPRSALSDGWAGVHQRLRDLPGHGPDPPQPGPVSAARRPLRQHDGGRAPPLLCRGEHGVWGECCWAPGSQPLGRHPAATPWFPPAGKAW